MFAKLQAPTPAKLCADQVKASIEVEEQKVSHETVSDSFTNIINPNMKLSVNHTIPGILKPEIGKEGGVGSMLQVIRDEIHQPCQPTGANDLYAVEDVRDYGIADEKAEIYANRLDNVLLPFSTTFSSTVNFLHEVCFLPYIHSFTFIFI
jgi:hypothetical protein